MRLVKASLKKIIYKADILYRLYEAYSFARYRKSFEQVKVLWFRYWDCSLPGQEGAEEELDAAQGVAGTSSAFIAGSAGRLMFFCPQPAIPGAQVQGSWP